MNWLRMSRPRMIQDSMEALELDAARKGTVNVLQFWTFPPHVNSSRVFFIYLFIYFFIYLFIYAFTVTSLSPYRSLLMYTIKQKLYLLSVRYLSSLYIHSSHGPREKKGDNIFVIDL